MSAPHFSSHAIKMFQRQLALLPVPLLAVADLVFERRQKVESDVCGLEILGIGVGHVVHQRAKSGRTRRGRRLRSGSQSRGVNARHQARRDGFDISFHSADLPGKETDGYFLICSDSDNKVGALMYVLRWICP